MFPGANGDGTGLPGRAMSLGDDSPILVSGLMTVARGQSSVKHRYVKRRTEGVSPS